MQNQRAELSESHESPGEEPTHGLLSELLVEVFLRRGAAHHGSVREAADEFRELFTRFGILTDENAALIEQKAIRLQAIDGRSRLRLVIDALPRDPAD